MFKGGVKRDDTERLEYDAMGYFAFIDQECTRLPIKIYAPTGDISFVELYIISWEKAGFSAIVTKPPVLVREFLCRVNIGIEDLKSETLTS